MSVYGWSAPSTYTSALTTDLNALANNALSAASAAIDNTADRYDAIDVEIALASLTPTGSPVVNVWIAYSTDGTNYDDGSVSEMQLLAVLPLSTSASAKRVSRGPFLLRPLKFKLYAENKAGPALAASGNVLSYRMYKGEGV